MKKSLRLFIEDNIFGKPINIQIGGTREECCKFYKLDYEDGDGKTAEGKWQGHEDGLQYVIRIKYNKNIPNFLATISHEIRHHVDEVMDRLGITCEETGAYYTAHFIRQITYGLQEHKVLKISLY